MTNIIKIHKAAGKEKQAIRVNGMTDIPEFLEETITIENGKLHLVCVEGDETAPLGSVIGYEKSEKTRTGYNAWWIANAATNLIEQNGKFFTKATVLEATPITDESPELMAGANIWRNEDGSWSLGASWGTQTGWPGEAYWVKSGETEDGTPKGYILTKSEETYGTFIICDDDGNDIGLLCEIDPA